MRADDRMVRVLDDAGHVLAEGTIRQFKLFAARARMSGLATCVQIEQDEPVDLTPPHALSADQFVTLSWSTMTNAG